MRNICVGFIVVILHLCPVFVTAKNIPVTIVVNDSETRNVRILNQKNEAGQINRLCVINEQTSFANPNQLDTIYYPGDVKGFILDNGQKFISGTVTIRDKEKTVFLKEVLNKKSLEVYSFKDILGEYLFIKDNQNMLTAISPEIEPYKTQLLQLNTCSKITRNNINNLKLNQNSILDGYKAVEKCNPNYLTRRNHFGIKGGYNYGHLTLDEFGDASHSFNIGFFGNIPLPSNYFSINTELYLQFEDYLVQGAYKYKRYSLELPVLARYTFLDVKGKTLPYFEVGPMLGYAFKNDLYYARGEVNEDPTNPDSPLITAYARDNINNLYYGIAAGIGLEYKISRKHSIYAGVRYMYTNASGVKVNNVQANIAVNIF